MKPSRHSRDRETRASRRGYVETRGIGLIYDRLGPKSPGRRVFWSSYIKIRKLLAAETGHKSSSVIPRNEWRRGRGRGRTGCLRVARNVRGTCARRRIYIILSGQWTERCRRSLPRRRNILTDWRTRGNSASKPDDDPR